jgi:hypothetical protein
MILKWQLYPWAHKDLARLVNRELDLASRRTKGLGGWNDGAVRTAAPRDFGRGFTRAVVKPQVRRGVRSTSMNTERLVVPHPQTGIRGSCVASSYKPQDGRWD